MLSGKHKKRDAPERFERKIFTVKKLYANLVVCGGSGGHLRFDNDIHRIVKDFPNELPPFERYFCPKGYCVRGLQTGLRKRMCESCPSVCLTGIHSIFAISV